MTNIKFIIALLAAIVLLSIIYLFVSASINPTSTIPASTILRSPTSNPTNTILNQTGGKIKHVIIIVLENVEYSSVINNSNASYENALANEYAIATNYFAVSHPSEPNYIAMIAGSTLNITNDGHVAQNQKSATNLVDLFKAKSVSWKAYEESIPTPCDENNSLFGVYVTNHDPFVYMTDITSNLTYCQSHVVGLDQFYSDLAANQLPQYAFITPNTNDDGHNTNIKYADNWLSIFMPKILNSSSFNSSVIILTYDEGTTNFNIGGHIATIFIGPSSIVKFGFKSNVFYTHYSLLATIESIFGLGNLGRNDVGAGVMSDMFVNSSASK